MSSSMLPNLSNLTATIAAPPDDTIKLPSKPEDYDEKGGTNTFKYPTTFLDILSSRQGRRAVHENKDEHIIVDSSTGLWPANRYEFTDAEADDELVKKVLGSAANYYTAREMKGVGRQRSSVQVYTKLFARHFDKYFVNQETQRNTLEDGFYLVDGTNMASRFNQPDNDAVKRNASKINARTALRAAIWNQYDDAEKTVKQMPVIVVFNGQYQSEENLNELTKELGGLSPDGKVYFLFVSIPDCKNKLESESPHGCKARLNVSMKDAPCLIVPIETPSPAPTGVSRAKGQVPDSPFLQDDGTLSPMRNVRISHTICEYDDAFLSLFFWYSGCKLGKIEVVSADEHVIKSEKVIKAAFMEYAKLSCPNKHKPTLPNVCFLNTSLVVMKSTGDQMNPLDILKTSFEYDGEDKKKLKTTTLTEPDLGKHHRAWGIRTEEEKKADSLPSSPSPSSPSTPTEFVAFRGGKGGGRGGRGKGGGRGRTSPEPLVVTGSSVRSNSPYSWS